MNTLRVKIAVLMVIVIVSVVFSLTMVLFYLLGPPKRVHSLAPPWRSRSRRFSVSSIQAARP